VSPGVAAEVPAPSPDETVDAARTQEFDLFISYSTEPDYPLARELERFLSRFHQLPGLQKHDLAPLRVCVDGSSSCSAGAVRCAPSTRWCGITWSGRASCWSCARREQRDLSEVRRKPRRRARSSISSRSGGFSAAPRRGKTCTSSSPERRRRRGALSQVAFSPDERRLAASDLAHCARVWTIDSGRAAPPVCQPDDVPSPPAWNPRTGELAVGWLSGKISVQQVAAGRERRLLEHHRASISPLGFDPAGRWLVLASSDGTLLWWDTSTWGVIGEAHEPGGSFVRDLAVSPDGATLATLDQGGSRLSAWSLDPDEWARRAKGLGGGGPRPRRHVSLHAERHCSSSRR
jgi:hypothetical protein